jgi:uncharacterized membrane protein
MILHLDPGAPAWMRVGAEALLALHISGAATALVSGPAAMILPKGGRLHRLTGNVFFVSMLAMTGLGAVIAPLLSDPFSSVGGAFAFYLTATGWAAVIRGPGRIGRFEPLALAFILAVASAAVTLGGRAIASPSGTLDGQPWQAAFIIAGLCALAAGTDLVVVLKGGVSGPARTLRHLWRMCLALLVAALSFSAQPKAQPEVLRGSPIWMIPALLILAGMIYWLVRVQLQRRRRPAAMAPGALSRT